MRRAARIGMLVLIGVLSAVGSSGGESTATPTVESAMSHLTGGGQRVWVKRRWVMVLAEGAPGCVQGEIWTFGQDGKGVKRTCVNGVARDEKFTWAWVGTEGDLPLLKVDEKHYVADFRHRKAQVEGDPPVLVTILRTPRTSQVTPVEEIILEFENM